MSFQNLVESIVEEMRKFLEVQPLLVLASKSCIFFAGSSTTDVQRLVDIHFFDVSKFLLSFFNLVLTLQSIFLPSVFGINECDITKDCICRSACARTGQHAW